MTIRSYLLLGLACAASVLSARAAEVHLDGNLKDLEKVLGKWEVKSSDPEEANNPSIETREADPGGRSVVVSIAPRILSKESEFIRSIWFFDPQVKQLVNVWVDSNGACGKDFLSPLDASKKEFTGKGTGISAAGEPFSYITHVKWTDDDTYVYWETDYTGTNTEKKPDSPKYTVRRIKS